MDWGFGMPPPGFDQLIAQKYAMEQQRTNAAVNQQNAEANLTNVRAGLLPQESNANVGEVKARTQGINITNRFLPALQSADIFRTVGQGQEAFSSSAYTDQQTKGLRALQDPMSFTSLGLGAGG